MPRPKRIDRPVEKHVCLPTSLVAKVELELYSELESKVPFGAWQKFLVGLVEAHFAKQEKQTALAEQLKQYLGGGDPEHNHSCADAALLLALQAEGYGTAVEVFKNIEKWYS